MWQKNAHSVSFLTPLCTKIYSNTQNFRQMGTPPAKRIIPARPPPTPAKSLQIRESCKKSPPLEIYDFSSRSSCPPHALEHISLSLWLRQSKNAARQMFLPGKFPCEKYYVCTLWTGRLSRICTHAPHLSLAHSHTLWWIFCFVSSDAICTYALALSTWARL